MTRRKPRATPRTVSRWLREGIPEKTWSKLVDGLAPSPATARRWAKEGIPEARLRELKAPPPKPKAKAPPKRRAPQPVAAAPARRPAARPSPAHVPERAPKTRRERTIKQWIDDGIPEDVFERVIEELAPDEDEAEQWREEEAIPVARLRRLEKIPRPPRPKPARFIAPEAPKPVLSAEQISGMKKLGLTEAQIAASGRPETDDERDARVEREAIQEVETAELRSPLEIEQARELSRLRSELARAQRMIEGPPPELPQEGRQKPSRFRFDLQPKSGESDEHWLDRIGEQIIAEAKREREGETSMQRADRLIQLVRVGVDRNEGEQLMDLVADVIALESGMSIRDVYSAFHGSPNLGSLAAS